MKIQISSQGAAFLSEQRLLNWASNNWRRVDSHGKLDAFVDTLRVSWSPKQEGGLFRLSAAIESKWLAFDADIFNAINLESRCSYLNMTRSLSCKNDFGERMRNSSRLSNDQTTTAFSFELVMI